MSAAEVLRTDPSESHADKHEQEQEKQRRQAELELLDGSMREFVQPSNPLCYRVFEPKTWEP